MEKITKKFREFVFFFFLPINPEMCMCSNVKFPRYFDRFPTNLGNNHLPKAVFVLVRQVSMKQNPQKNKADKTIFLDVFKKTLTNFCCFLRKFEV